MSVYEFGGGKQKDLDHSTRLTNVNSKSILNVVNRNDVQPLKRLTNSRVKNDFELGVAQS
jgi:hypothetical protein